MRDGNAGQLRMRLFGAFQLSATDGAPIGVTGRRARALLSYLALTPGRSASRERLCGLLWGDRGEAQARASLRQCLLALRLALGDANSGIVASTREDVSLMIGGVSVDTDNLSGALTSNDTSALINILGRIEDSRLLDDVEVAGPFRDWRDQTRARIDRQIADGVVDHLERLRASGDWYVARALADTYLRRDPLDETIAAYAIRAEGALGATAGAQRRYHLIKGNLASAFGVAPGEILRSALAEASSEYNHPTTKRTGTLTGSGDDGRSSPPPGVRAPDEDGSASPNIRGERPRLAVLAFDNYGSNDSRSSFADALTDELIAGLSKSGLFTVVSRQSSDTYNLKNMRVKAVCADLGADYVIHGAVRIMGGTMRVTARLVRRSDELTVASASFSRPGLEDAENLDETTAMIVGALEPAVLEHEQTLALNSPERDGEFWSLFVRGRQLFWRSNTKDVREAERLLEKALAVRADDACAMAMLAHCKLYDVWVASSKDPAVAIGEAYRIALVAVSVSGTDAFAHYTLGVVLAMMNRVAEAEAEQRRALELNPFLAAASGELGRLYAFAGRASEALAHSARAIAVSPNDPHAWLWHRSKAIARFVMGEYDEAALNAAEACARGPRRFYLHLLLAACHSAAGRPEEAHDAFKLGRRLAREDLGDTTSSSGTNLVTVETLKIGHPFADRSHLVRLAEAINLAATHG